MYVSTDRLILESWYDGIPPVLNWKIESFNIWFWRMEKYHCVWVHWKHCLRRVNGYGWSHCPFLYNILYIVCIHQIYIGIVLISVAFDFWRILEDGGKIWINELPLSNLFSTYRYTIWNESTLYTCKETRNCFLWVMDEEKDRITDDVKINTRGQCPAIIP